MIKKMGLEEVCRKLSKKKKCKKKNNEVRKNEKENGNICGNLELNNQVSNLDIWEVYHDKNATVFLSLDNSPTSTDTIRVRAYRKDGSFLFFNVPPGNTSSGTIDHADRINVSRVNRGSIEGRFCLDVRFHSSKD
jgi:hypothetical protein